MVTTLRCCGRRRAVGRHCLQPARWRSGFSRRLVVAADYRACELEAPPSRTSSSTVDVGDAWPPLNTSVGFGYRLNLLHKHSVV